MIDYRSLEQQLAKLVEFPRRPVAVAFRDAAPAGVRKFSGSQPSGCSFWKLAAEGRPFYTVAADHYNCPIGSHTHGIDLPQVRAPELEQTLALMTGIGYIRMTEVANIPRLPKAPGVVIYAALGDTPADPDVVLFSGKPGRVMLLQEAALRAGVAAQLPLLGRPTCMALPAALAGGALASSSCIGNRVYTGVGEEELYVVIPGKDLARVAEEAATIADANSKLKEYHLERRRTLSA